MKRVSRNYTANHIIYTAHIEFVTCVLSFVKAMNTQESRLSLFDEQFWCGSREYINGNDKNSTNNLYQTPPSIY